MNINIRITRDESGALTKLRDAGRLLAAPLLRAFSKGAQEVLGRAVRGRFTGKGPFPVSQNKLGVGTNRLRRSMRATLAQVDSATGTISLGMGSNVSHFAPHEFGFRGRVQVRSHTRKADAQSGQRNNRGKLTRGAINAAKNRILVRGRANFSYVKAHTRQVNVPARRPLGTELKSIQTRLTFRKAVTEVIRFLTKLKP